MKNEFKVDQPLPTQYGPKMVSALIEQPLTLRRSNELIDVTIYNQLKDYKGMALMGGNKKLKKIDSYNKNELKKLAKENNIKVKKSDGTLKTKEQLFNSLKRKNLI